MTARSILAEVDKSAIRDEPFPHLVVENALPQDYYERLAAEYPALDLVANGRDLESDTLYLRSTVDVVDDERFSPAWREFFAYHSSPDFFREVTRFWGERIERIHPELERNFGKSTDEFSMSVRRPGKHDNPENRDTDVVLDCQFGSSSEVRRVQSVRLPHVDNHAKMYAALVYFRRPDDESTGGNLQLHRLKDGKRYPRRKMHKIDPSIIELVREIPYAPNTLVMWLNSAQSIHGVTPRSITDVPRQYVNILGECYAGRKDDYFTAFESRGRLAALRDRFRAR